MLIIIDTCILQNDIFLDGVKIDTLCTYAPIRGIKVALPMVVFNEKVNHYREDIIEKSKSLITAIKNFRKLSQKLGSIYPEENIDSAEDLVKKYSDYLRSRCSTLNIDFLPYPKSNIPELLQKDLLAKKPFKKKGVGYRDAFIWDTILESLKPTDKILDEPQIIFITENTTDFYDSEKKCLHPDLKEELVKKGFPEESVVVSKSIDEVIKEYLSTKQSALEKEKDKLKKLPYIGETDLYQQFADDAENQLRSDLDDNDNWNLIKLGFNSVLETPELTDFQLKDIDITDIRLLPDKRILIKLKGVAETYIEGFVDKSDYYLNDGFKGECVSASDWNDYMMSVDIQREFLVQANIITNPYFSEILSSDIDVSYQ
ncbi:MAG: DUF4935 domain-containing protein [Muribaculaceae bacterium]|nr:DUF4935 domain-containing protein [Muribaculaceae bacterium]